MANLFQSEQLIVTHALETDIQWIMTLERKDENKNFVFQGSYKDHLKEINDPATLLCIIKEKKDHQTIGYFLGEHDSKNNIFEFRRFVIDLKGQGFGTELTKALMAYTFNALEINRFWLDVFTYNMTGIHVYEKLGLNRDGIIREGYKDGDTYKSYYIYSILKREYEDLY